MRKQIGSFDAYDSSGKRHKIVVSKDHDGEGAVDGVVHLNVGGVDGPKLNRAAKGKYVTPSGIELHSNDVNAA